MRASLGHDHLEVALDRVEVAVRLVDLSQRERVARYGMS